MRWWLAVSVALNLCLLTTMVAARIDPERSNARAAEGVVAVGVFDAEGIEGTAASAGEGLLAILAGTTLSEADVKSLVLGWLETKYRDAFEAPGVSFWQPGYLPGGESLAAQLTMEERVREALQQLFGAAAAEDPAFDAAFRPLGPSYAFLGSAAQLSLRRQQLEGLERLEEPDASGPGAVDASRSAMLCRHFGPEGPESSAGLDVSDFSEHEYAEYRLRFSPLAAQLREAGVAGSEVEFREWYALLQQLERSAAPSDRAAIRADLRSRMGDDTFARFWSLRDPLFPPVDEYLTRLGFARHDVLAAYAVINRSQEALLNAAGRGTGDASLIPAVERVGQDEARRLSRLLGEEAAAGLRAAISNFSLRLSQGSVAAC